MTMSMSDLTTEVIPAASLASRAALWVADRLWSAVAARGVAHLAVSGGSTPLAMFTALAHLDLPWPHVHVWQVDERVCPDGASDRNAGQLASLTQAGAVVHLLEVGRTDLSLEGAAAAYAAQLPQRFDVIHLGLGDDGHTASWPPNDPVIDVLDPVAIVGPFNGRVRLTLTPPVINHARSVMFLVAGAAKAPMLARLRAADPSIPASIVRRPGTTILTDVADR
jgi:6-phosphogluconolactonase